MTTQDINNSIEQALSLRLIAGAYTEISSARLKKIRDQVEKNRQYMTSLAQVYMDVKQVATTKNLLPKKTKKTVSILITSNYHFYGNINNELIKFFLSNMHVRPTDQIIIGKTAQEWTRTKGLIFQNDYPTPEELNNLVSKTKDYEQIIVYFSQMRTVMQQVPTFLDITQSSNVIPAEAGTNTRHSEQTTRHSELGSESQRSRVKHGMTEEKLFIFEPEIEKILDFFNSQVTNLLLQQTFLESELSRSASRLISMDQAQTKANKYLTEQQKLLSGANRARTNTKLLETYAAVMSLKKYE